MDEFLTTLVAAAVELDMDKVQLDNGANCHVLNNKKYFTNILDHAGVNLSGVYNNVYKFECSGDTRYGPAYYSPTARNILSQSLLEKNGFYSSPVRSGEDGVIKGWKLSRGNEEMNFSLQNGIFVSSVVGMDTSEDATSVDAPPMIDLPVAPPELDTPPMEVLDQSVSEEIPDQASQDPIWFSKNLARNLTKLEREKMSIVTELHAALGHPSLSTMKKAIQCGVINNTILTARDIDIYKELFPTCRGCLQGKMRAPSQVAYDPPSGALIGQYWEADLAFLNSKTVLILVEILSNFIIVFTILNKREASIGAASKIWHSYLASRFSKAYISGKIIVRTDRELALQALGNVERVAAEEHASRVEAQIRVLKERCRSILFSLDYHLPYELYDSLMKFVGQIKNYLPATVNGLESPMGIVVELNLVKFTVYLETNMKS